MVGRGATFVMQGLKKLKPGNYNETSIHMAGLRLVVLGKLLLEVALKCRFCIFVMRPGDHGVKNKNKAYVYETIRVP